VLWVVRFLILELWFATEAAVVQITY